MNNKSLTLAVVAAVAVMLVATSAVATEDAFAGKKKREYNQATSQANACGNGEIHIDDNHDGSTNGASTMDGGSDYELSGGTFCQNIDSQIQGDENAVAQAADQVFP
ncbi:MAG: hypothetical protein WAK50_16730 [Nitrososphaeraceae archaeon]|jgi:hypothetical protein